MYLDKKLIRSPPSTLSSTQLILGSPKHPKHYWPVAWGPYSRHPFFPCAFLVHLLRHGSRQTTQLHFLSKLHRLVSLHPSRPGWIFTAPTLQFKSGIYLFSSMALHDLEDLPVRVQVANKHFLPFKQLSFIALSLIGNHNSATQILLSPSNGCW